VATEHPRARRYPFTASIELTDITTEAQTRERTLDVSLYGCRVETGKPLQTGTKIRIRIAHRGSSFAALGRIAHAGRNGEMGITFTSVERNDQLILERWIAELRDERKPVRTRPGMQSADEK